MQREKKKYIGDKNAKKGKEGSCVCSHLLMHVRDSLQPLIAGGGAENRRVEEECQGKNNGNLTSDRS